jgi:hypothetical protein
MTAAAINKNVATQLGGKAGTDWVVMGYLAGDNNLSEEMVLALQYMQNHNDPVAGAPCIWPRVEIMAQFDPSGVGIPTQRYIFKNHSGASNQVSPLREYRAPAPSITDTNTGNPDCLAAFAEWAIGEAQTQSTDAKHALILSGHGSGTTEDFLMADENPVDSLSIPELAIALKRINGSLGKKLDLLGMDACYMSMLEVAYQIRDYADFVVGAEGLEPEFGWPYHWILQSVEHVRRKEKCALTAEQLAKIIVSQYLQYYYDYNDTIGASADMAAIRTTGLKGIALALKPLAKNLLSILLSKTDPSRISAIIYARAEAQSYKANQFTDLRDFCLRLIFRFDELSPGSTVSTLAQNVIAAIDQCVLICGCLGPKYQHSWGLSIYFPWSDVSTAYQEANLEFLKVSKWHEFLKVYVEKTRRESRIQMQAPKAFGPPQSIDFKKLAPLAKKFHRMAERQIESLVSAGDGSGMGHKYAIKTKYFWQTKYFKQTKGMTSTDSQIANISATSGILIWCPPKSPEPLIPGNLNVP